MGYGISSAAGIQGGFDELKQMLAQRVAARQYADRMNQQAFENQRQLAGDQRASQAQAIDQQRYAAQEAQRQATAAEAARKDTYAEADKLGEQYQPGAELMPQSPAVATMQAGGRGDLLQPRMTLPSRQMTGGGVTPEASGSFPEAQPAQGFLRTTTRTQAKPEVYIKTATQKQMDTLADNQRQAGMAATQAATESERERHDKAMESAALSKPNTAESSRGDRSYQYHMGQVDKVAAPITSQLDRLTRLKQSIDQGTAVADSVIAPELISALAGGQGSGVRITQSELNAVTHGRSTVEDVKGWLQKVQNGQSITPEQRQQMRALVGAVHQKAQQKSSALDQARGELIDATDPAQHRQIYGRLQHTLNDMASDSGSGQTPSAGGLVPMVAPDGRALSVPADKVSELEAKGARRR